MSMLSRSAPSLPPTTRRTLLIGCLVAMLTVLASIAGPVSAAPGDLDPGFDFDGKRLVGRFGTTSHPTARILEQSDGKLVTVGQDGVARFNADGSLDTGFGLGGLTVLNFDQRGAGLSDVAQQPDGRLVVVGAVESLAANGRFDWLIARLNTDGSLDTSFNAPDGFVRVNTGGCCDSISGVQVIQSGADAGKILVTGRLGSLQVTLARYLPSGSLDTTFGNDPGNNVSTVAGIVRTVVGYSDQGSRLALQPDGRILVGGGSIPSAGGDSDAMVVRYHADGSLDTTFGTGGAATMDYGGRDHVYDLAVQADGKVVVAGDSWPVGESTYDAIVGRFNPDGSVDTDFDGPAAYDQTGSGDGMWLFDWGTPGTGAEVFRDVEIQSPGGEILLFGVLGDCGSCQILVRLDPTDGSLDTSFVDNLSDSPGFSPPAGMILSKIVDPANVFFTNGEDMEVLSTGKIVTVGGAGGGPGLGFTHVIPLARYNADGTADLSFDIAGDVTGPGNGRVSVAITESVEANALSIAFDGQIFQASTAASGDDSRMAVMNLVCTGGDAPSGGSIRRTVDIPGGSEVAADMAVLPDTKLVLVGTHRPQGSTDGVFAVARFDSNPMVRRIDGTFGTGGWVTTDIPGADDAAAAVAIQADGKILAVGSAGIASGADIAVVRYDDDGSLDTGFAAGGADGDGIATFDLDGGDDRGTDVAVLPDGKILVSAYGEVGGDLDIAVLRLLSDGSLDTSFDGDGVVVHDLFGPDERTARMALGGDGSIALVGEITPDASQAGLAARDMLVARLTAGGGLDTGFDTDGWLQQDVLGEDSGTDVALMPDGRIVATAEVISTTGTAAKDFMVYRYNTNGTADTSFGTGGLAKVDHADVWATSYEDAARSVVVQHDEKVLVAGHSNYEGAEASALTFARFEELPASEQPAEQNKLYGLNQSYGYESNPYFGPSTLVEIDPTTGEAEVIGPTCINDASAMAIAPDGTIFAADDGGNPFTAGTRIYTIDTATGASTLVGSNSLDWIPSMAFAPEGTLYAIRQSFGGSTGQALYTIDTGTGAATHVVDVNTRVEAMAIDTDGTIYVVGITSPAAVGLGTIDTSTGVVTEIGLVGFYEIRDLSFTTDGTRLLATSTVNDSLIEINPSTGAGTVVGAFGAQFQGLGAIAAGPQDSDGDGILNVNDNCPFTPNPLQENYDLDAEGDACDTDDDNDGVLDVDDAFPLDETEWEDTDSDGTGNNADTDDDNDGQLDVDEIACGSDPLNALSQSPDNDGDHSPDCVDADDDNDGYADGVDAFPLDETEWVDTDSDGTGNNADTDDDNDLQLDVDEVACGSDPLDVGSLSPDNDGDNSPDCVDADDDNDGVLDVTDNCAVTANPDQTDTDGDGVGDVCDEDDDGDTVLDTNDNCPLTPNADQADIDGDGKGDACDPAPVVTSFTADVEPVELGTAVDAQVQFTDEDNDGDYTVIISWGDSANTEVTVSQATDIASASHTYATTGVYVLTVDVEDADGNIGSATFRYVVIYDPDGGFVTGGGWINSPAGAYAADPTLTGKANFGFVSKYKNGRQRAGGQHRVPVQGRRPALPVHQLRLAGDRRAGQGQVQGHRHDQRRRQLQVHADGRRQRQQRRHLPHQDLGRRRRRDLRQRCVLRRRRLRRHRASAAATSRSTRSRRAGAKSTASHRGLPLCPGDLRFPPFPPAAAPGPRAIGTAL